MTRRMLIAGAGSLAGVFASATVWSARAFQAKSATARKHLTKDPATPPRNDKWQVVGPGGGGAQYRPTLSPHDDNLVLVTCDMGGIYISEDGGRLWRMINLRAQARFIVFDPSNPAVIYVGVSGCIYRSEDRGRAWNLILPRPASIKMRFIEDEADIAISDADQFGAVTALAVDPADSNAIYVSTGKDIHYSKDRGRHFSHFTSVDRSPCLELFLDPHSPPHRRVLYGRGKNWVAACAAGKWSGGAELASKGGLRSVSLSFPAQGPPLIYGAAAFETAGAGHSGGVIVSRDQGATWQSLSEGFMRLADAGSPPPDLNAIAAAPDNPAVVYVSYDDLITAGRHCQGVAVTTDGGRTWSNAFLNTSDFAANLSEAWFPDRFEASWPENPRNMSVSPRHPNLCFGTDSGRTIRTTDGGQSWEQLYAQCLEDGTYTTTGLDVTTTYGVHFDPFDRSRLFITFTDIGLFRSENRGRSWAPSNFGCPREWRNTTYWVEFDPAVRGLMWAVMSGTHDLPRSRMCCDTSKYHGGVCVSRDGGKNWKLSSSGMPQIAATHILLDPESPPDARVLYVAAYGKGVFKSSDGGASWTVKNHGIESETPLAWRIERDPKGVLYLVLSRRRAADYGTPGDGAIYRSVDGAESWTRLPLPKGVNGPNGIAIDPQNPQRLYLACWGRYGRSTGGGMLMNGGILVSDDAGAHWRSVFEGDQHVFDITIDPVNPAILYAAGHECNIWRSADRGQSWSRIRGFNFKAAQRVVPDLNDPAMVYVTTFGGGVWHGPAEGDPEAVEDIVTPEVAFHAPEPKPNRKASK